jgi:hypothetical protein
MSDAMIRVDRELLARMKEVITRHPLKPSIRSTVARAIELMIEDLEEEIKNANR